MRRGLRDVWAALAVLLILLLPAVAHGQATGPYVQQMTLGRGLIRSGAWSPDGQTIAIGGGLGIWLYTSDLEDLGCLTGHEKAVYGVAFSPDGTRLASASHDQTVRIWDVASQQEQHTLRGHGGLVVTVAWSPDGKTVASGSYDKTVRLWDPDTGELRNTLRGHAGWVQQVAFSPDGALVISSSHDGTLGEWDAATGELRAIVQGTADAWATLTGQNPGTYVGPRVVAYQRAWSPDESKLLFVNWNGGARVLDAATSEVLASQEAHMDWITRVQWDATGAKLLSASADGYLRTWDSATGDLLDVQPGDLPEDAPTDEAVSSSGARALVARDGAVQIVAGDSGEAIAVLPGLANAVAWSPDGARLAVAARNGTIQIWRDGSQPE